MDNKLTAFQPELDIADICEDIANGTTLAKFCKDRALHFGEIRTWIRGDKEREKQYKIATELRKEWAAQLICDTVLQMALFDPKDVLLMDGTMKPLCDWPPSARAALANLDIDAAGNIKAKFESRLKAFELVGKTLNIFAQKVQVNAGESLADLVTKAIGSDGKKSNTGENKKVSTEGGEGSNEVEKAPSD